jgi:hypothetical protein
MIDAGMRATCKRDHGGARRIFQIVAPRRYYSHFVHAG